MTAPKPKLQRCKLLIDRGCTLIPCGPKKNPLQKGWPTVRGSTIEELANYPGVKAVGLRTGPKDGRIICIDVDGESADRTLKANKLDPFINNGAPAFVVGRRNDPHHYKVISSSLLSRQIRSGLSSAPSEPSARSVTRRLKPSRSSTALTGKWSSEVVTHQARTTSGRNGSAT